MIWTSNTDVMMFEKVSMIGWVMDMIMAGLKYTKMRDDQ